MSPTQIIHEFAVKNMLVEKYLLGELHGADLEDFEQHLYECSICFEEVKTGREFAQGVKDVGTSTDWRSISRRLMVSSLFIASTGIVLMLASPLSIVLADVGKVLACVAAGVFLLGLAMRPFIGGRS